MRTAVTSALVLPLLLGCAPLEPATSERALSIIDTCAHYPDQHQGVWLDEFGQERVRFVLASDHEGNGCFGLLNAYKPWGILEPELSRPKVSRTVGKLVAISENGKTSILLNSDTREALLVGPNGTIRGRLEAPGELLHLL